MTERTCLLNAGNALDDQGRFNIKHNAYKCLNWIQIFATSNCH